MYIYIYVVALFHEFTPKKAQTEGAEGLRYGAQKYCIVFAIHYLRPIPLALPRI